MSPSTPDLAAPLTFSPRFQTYVWGGRNLERVLGRDIPPGIVAESWEISAHPAAPTVVDHGPLAGRDLADLTRELGVALVGRRGAWAVERGTFPLLIKLLDANQPLSVQVHPDDAYAGAHEDGELGKTEMWYILHAEPGAEIVYGVRAGTDRDAFEEAAKEGQLSDHLHRVPVEAGDSVLIPAGTVHAILEGVVLAEVQQSSNTTYRVYDWGRVDSEGESRPLHLAKALDVIDFEQVEPRLWSPTVVEDVDGVRREEIARCDKFVVERVTLGAGSSLRGTLDGGSFEVWGVLQGSATVSTDHESRKLDAVRFALFPASMGSFRVEAPVEATALRAYLP